MKREYSLHQILVLCGTREQKHLKRLAEITEKSENSISTWSTRGIPHQYWTLVGELADVTIGDICGAQAHATGRTYGEEFQRFLDLATDEHLHVDKPDA